MKFYIIQYGVLDIKEVDGYVVGDILKVEEVQEAGRWTTIHKSNYAEYFKTYEEAYEKLSKELIEHINTYTKKLNRLKDGLNNHGAGAIRCQEVESNV